MYDPKIWTIIGPALLTSFFKQKCEFNVTTFNNEICSEVTLYPIELFYPFDFGSDDLDRAFNRTYMDTQLLEASEQCYGVHFWNKNSGAIHLTIRDNTLMNVLAEKHCKDSYFSSEDFDN